MTYHIHMGTNTQQSINIKWKGFKGETGNHFKYIKKNVIHNSAVIFMNLYATNNITWNKTNNENKTNTETEGKIYL